MINFKNYAWRGVRLEAENPQNKDEEYSIEFHMWHGRFAVREYYHQPFGPTKGKYFYYFSWEDLKKHFKQETNLNEFDEKAQELIVEYLAKKI
jgi:hypothetical protein